MTHHHFRHLFTSQLVEGTMGHGKLSPAEYLHAHESRLRSKGFSKDQAERVLEQDQQTFRLAQHEDTFFYTLPAGLSARTRTYEKSGWDASVPTPLDLTKLRTLRVPRIASLSLSALVVLSTYADTFLDEHVHKERPLSGEEREALISVSVRYGDAPRLLYAFRERMDALGIERQLQDMYWSGDYKRAAQALQHVERHKARLVTTG